MLIDALGGPENVAEMTGRTTRIVRRPDARKGQRSGTRGVRGGANSDGDGTKLVYEKRGKGGAADSVNIQERKKFQCGKKLVAIIR
jgi:hypothetical protein